MQAARRLSAAFSFAASAVALALLAACGGGSSSSQPAGSANNSSSATALPPVLATAKALGRGINFGDMLDAPTEGAWSVRLSDANFKVSDAVYDDFIAKSVAAGFKTVRLPVRFSNHAALTADATLDAAFAGHVENLVDRMLAQGLYVILDMHHYRQFDGDALDPGETAVDPAVVDARFLNLWAQLGERFKGKSAKLLFSLYNEPHGRLDAAKWNALAAQALAIVRKTNPTRIALVGPVSYNSAWYLKDLQLPADSNLIVDIHTYDPISFTFQGLDFYSPYQPAGVACCSDKQKQDIVAPLDVAAKWSEATRFPVYVGEFGVSKFAGLADRASYARYARDQMEARGMSWAYWDWAGNFRVYDQDNRSVISALRDALLAN